METISYKLPVFEGPLDLLLFLVQKNKLNIYDIPIAEVLEQYIDTIRRMQESDMEVASEFLDMAARLVYIKSSLLLPKHEEAELLKAELTGALVEYRLCQEVAARLSRLYVGGDIYVRSPAEVEHDHTYKLTHSAKILADAYLSAAGKGKRRLPPPREAFSGIVSRPVISVSSRILHVLQSLRDHKPVAYGALFRDAKTKSELVATFLALLELVKEKQIAINGEGTGQTVEMLDGAEADKIGVEYVSEFEVEKSGFLTVDS